MMKWFLLFFLTLIAVPAGAQTTQDAELQIRVARDGMAPGSNFSVLIHSPSGEIAQGTATFRDGIGPGAIVTARVRLNGAIDASQVAYIGLQGHGDSVAVRHLSFRVGDRYPSTILVNQTFDPPWRGSSRNFAARRVSERSLQFVGLRVRGTVVDTARHDNHVEFWVELTNGKMYVIPGVPELHRAGPFEASITLPEPISRNAVKRLRVYSGRSPIFRVTSFDQLFFETDDVLLRDVRFDGWTANDEYHLIDEFRQMALNNHRVSTGDLLTDQPSGVREYRPTWFNVYVFTGNDDLRWDPNVQPNMEFKVNLYIRGNSSPIPIVTRSLEPYAPFANGGVWGGSFAGYDIAERTTQWRSSSRPPRIQEIEAIEIEVVPGWDGSTPTRRILRGQGDPFRQPDEWAFRGIWVGAADAFPQLDGNDRQVLAPWHTLVCEFMNNRKLKVGDRLRFPVDIGVPSYFNPDVGDILRRP